MEESLFDFDSCDGNADEIIYFGIELKQPVGIFPKGEKFNSAKLDTEKGQLSFYRGDSLLGRYSVQLAVTKDLLESE
jgi:hypothetical protein